MRVDSAGKFIVPAGQQFGASALPQVASVDDSGNGLWLTGPSLLDAIEAGQVAMLGMEDKVIQILLFQFGPRDVAEKPFPKNGPVHLGKLCLVGLFQKLDRCVECANLVRVEAGTPTLLSSIRGLENVPPCVHGLVAFGVRRGAVSRNCSDAS